MILDVIYYGIVAVVAIVVASIIRNVYQSYFNSREGK